MSRRGSERRRFVRVAEEVVVSVTATDDAGPVRDGMTLNLSVGGVLIALPTPLPIGTDVQIVLRLDAERLLPFSARVTRVRTLSDHCHEIACELTTGSVSDQRALQDLIYERLAAPLDATPQPA